MLIARSLCAITFLIVAIDCVMSPRTVAYQTCKRPSGVEERAFPDDLPIALRNAVKEKLGEVVPPGEKFDSTDRIVTGKNRRAIFVWMRGNRWVIATEHGGLGYNNPIFAFYVSADGLQAKLVAEAIAFPHSICAIALKQIE